MMTGRTELKRTTRSVRKNNKSFKKESLEGFPFLMGKTSIGGNNRGEEGVTI